MVSRARRVWRDKIAGPTLRTYDAACEELGGEPWRPLPEATDRWFLVDRPKSFAGLAALPQPPILDSGALDTGAFDLRRHMSTATKLVLAGGIALVAITLSVIALVGGSDARSAAPPAPTIVAPAVAPPSHPAPAPVAAAAAAPPAAVAAVAVASAPAAPPIVKHRIMHRRRH